MRSILETDSEKVDRLTKKALERVPEVVERDVRTLVDTLTADDDPALGPLLRFHLLVEQLFGRLFLLAFREPTLLDRFGFSQKLTIVRALPNIPEIGVEGLEKVNQLRNRSAHVHAHRIQLADIDRLGETVDSYQELRAQYADNLKILIVWTLSKLAEPLLIAVTTMELTSRVQAEEIK